MTLTQDAVTSEWIRTPNDELAAEQGCYFDFEAADRVRRFFVRFLRHSKGKWAGQPFELLDWEWRDVIAPLFGWKWPDGTRRFRRAHIEIPKKNGKSTLMAGTEIYLLVADGEDGAEVYTAAADRKQASIIFHEAANMVAQSPALRNRIMVTPSQKHLGFPQTNSVLEALSADAPTKEGLNASAVIFDELHAQTDRRLWDTLLYAAAAREQYDRESVCWEQHEYAEGVIKGEIEDLRFLGVIFAADEKEDISDEAMWHRVNPSLGHTITLESFREDYQRAISSVTTQNTFRRYRVNQWTEQETRWLDMDAWNACEGKVDDTELEGCECYAGLDLASTSDITALGLVFPVDKKYLLRLYFWVPESLLQERDIYREWAKAGWLETTPGNVTDYDWIRVRISGPSVLANEPERLERLKSLGIPERSISEQFNIREIAFDPWNATQMANNLEADGFNLVQFRQGFVSMNEPSKAFERLINAGQIVHDNPVLTWMARNVCVKTDPAANIKPVKPTKGKAKVDGIVTVIMALARAMFSPEPEEVGGIIVI